MNCEGPTTTSISWEKMSKWPSSTTTTIKQTKEYVNEENLLENKRLVKNSKIYREPYEKVEKSIKEFKINSEDYRDVLHRMASGEIKSRKDVEDRDSGFFANNEAKKMILSDNINKENLSPMAQANAAIKILQKGGSANDVKKGIAKASAKKEMQKMFGCIPNEGGKGGEKNDEEFDEEVEIFKSSKNGTPTDEILKIIKSENERLNFASGLTKKIIEDKSGDTTMVKMAKNISDLDKAKSNLFAMPKMLQSQMILTNQYGVKKKFKVEKKVPRIIILEDTSGSMDGAPRIWATATIAKLIYNEIKNKLVIKDIWGFGDEVIKFGLKENVNKLKEYVKIRKKIKPGGTEAQQAIIDACKLMSEEEKGEILILTDGAFDIKNEIYEKVKNLKVKINSLVVSDMGEKENMKKLSLISGGIYTGIKRSEIEDFDYCDDRFDI